jgi:hypothetical protein
MVPTTTVTRSEPDVPPSLQIGVAVEMGRQVETPDGCTLWEPGLGRGIMCGMMLLIGYEPVNMGL